MNNLHRQIKSIYHQVLTHWEKVEFAEEKFPRICYEALAMPTDYNVEEILEFTNLAELPVQSYPLDEFGEIPFTIFRHERFFIDIYMWNVHNTSIHDHNFLGAFKLLHGHSKKMNYDFVVEKQLAENFYKGELKAYGIQDLNPGDREMILPFEKYIHKITHLHNPTVTLLIRTNGLGRNLNLYNKKFVFQYRRTQPEFVPKFNCIKMIYAYEQDHTKDKLKQLIQQLDHNGLFQLLLAYININPSQVSGDNIARMYMDFKELADEGSLPAWFAEFLALEVQAREKEIRFQKMKLLGIL